jgi:hypothetical protein
MSQPLKYLTAALAALTLIYLALTGRSCWKEHVGTAAEQKAQQEVRKAAAAEAAGKVHEQAANDHAVDAAQAHQEVQDAHAKTEAARAATARARAALPGAGSGPWPSAVRGVGSDTGTAAGRVASGSVADGGNADAAALLRTVEQQRALIEAQDEQIAAMDQEMAGLRKENAAQGAEVKELRLALADTQEALGHERQARMAQEVATKAWKDACRSERNRGRMEGGGAVVVVAVAGKLLHLF